MKTDVFQSCGNCWVFQICWHIECSTFTASAFRIWNSSTGIPSPPLALFIVSNSVRPYGLEHTRLPCPSPTPGVYLNSCPLSRQCHPAISFSVVPFSSRLQSFPASESFQMSQFFTSGGQSIGVSASASVLPMNIQGWLPLGWTGWISLQSKGLSRDFSNTTSFLYSPTLTSTHDYWKNHSFD